MSEERFYELYDQARSLLQADQPDPARALCDQLFAIDDVPSYLKEQAESLLDQIEAHPAYSGSQADAEDTVMDGDFGFPAFDDEQDSFGAFDDEMIPGDMLAEPAEPVAAEPAEPVAAEPAEPVAAEAAEDEDEDEEGLEALDPNEALAMMNQQGMAEPVDPFAETQYGSMAGEDGAAALDPSGGSAEDMGEPVDPFADFEDDEEESGDAEEWDAVADTVVEEAPEPSEAFGLDEDEEDESAELAAGEPSANGFGAPPAEEEFSVLHAGSDEPRTSEMLSEPEEPELSMHEVRETKSVMPPRDSEEEHLLMREREELDAQQEEPSSEELLAEPSEDEDEDEEPELPLDEEQEFVPVVVQKAEQQAAEEAEEEVLLATKEEEESAVEVEIDAQAEAAERDFRMYEVLAHLRIEAAEPVAAATNGVKPAVAAKGKIALAGQGEAGPSGSPRRTSRLSDLFAALTLSLHPYKMLYAALSLLLAVGVFAGIIAAIEAQRSGEIDRLIAEGLAVIGAFLLYGVLAALPTGIAHQTRAQLEGRFVPGPWRTTRFVWSHASVALVWPFVVVGFFGGALLALDAFGGLGAAGAEALPVLYLVLLLVSLVALVLLIGFYLPSAIIGMGRAKQLTTLGQRFFRLFGRSFGHVLLYTVVLLILTAFAAAVFVGLHIGLAALFDQSFAQGEAWSASWPAEVVGALHQLVIWFPPLYEWFVSIGLIEPVSGAPVLSPVTVSIAVAYLVVAAVLVAYVLGTFFTGGTIAYALLRRRQRERMLAES